MSTWRSCASTSSPLSASGCVEWVSRVCVELGWLSLEFVSAQYTRRRSIDTAAASSSRCPDPQIFTCTHATPAAAPPPHCCCSYCCCCWKRSTTVRLCLLRLLLLPTLRTLPLLLLLLLLHTLRRKAVLDYIADTHVCRGKVDEGLGRKASLLPFN